MRPWPPAPRRPDRLSDLSDDVITHILSFAPTKEAASTTALSRRWRRPLWLDTAAVNLDSRSHVTGICKHNALCFPDLDGRVIKKVSIVVRNKHIPGDALSRAVEAGVEELRLECQDGGCPDYTYATPSPSFPSSYDVNLSLDMLLSASLRVLDLTGCRLSTYSPEDDCLYQHSYTCWNCYQSSDMSWSWDIENNCQPPDSVEQPWDAYHYESVSHWCPAQPPRPEITLPCLEALRLQRCAIGLDTLQILVDAAPRLANLRLESLSIMQEWWQVSFRCPSLAVLVMANLHTLNGTAIGGCYIKLDAPRLRCLRLTQSMCSNTSLEFQSPTPNLEQVHLATHSASPKLRSSILADVHHIRFLKLTSYSIIDIADDDLPVFPNLERLEVEELTGGCVLDHGVAASAVVNMLRKCPALRELRFKFSWRNYLRATVPEPVIQKAAMSDFPPCRSINASDEENCCCEGLELSCCGCRLDCLQNSLRRVVMKFDTEELTCFRVRLVKFLVEKGTLLKEVVINGVDGYDSSWINRNVAKWRESHRHHSVRVEEEEIVCFQCCMVVGSLSVLPPSTPIPIWPPSLLEFPPLENPLFSDGEVEYDEDEEDISHTYLKHDGREKKKMGLPECFTVAPKAKGLMSAGQRRGATHHQHHRSRVEGQDTNLESWAVTDSYMLPAPGTPTPQWPLSLSEFPPLVHTTSPTPLFSADGEQQKEKIVDTYCTY